MFWALLVIIRPQLNPKQAYSRLNLAIEVVCFFEPNRMSTKTITNCAGAVMSRVKRYM